MKLMRKSKTAQQGRLSCLLPPAFTREIELQVVLTTKVLISRGDCLLFSRERVACRWLIYAAQRAGFSDDTEFK